MDSALSFYRERYSLTGFDASLNEEERAFQDMMHRFAKEVMRPIGQQLDKMDAADVIAADSPLWTVYAKFAELGIVELIADGEMDPITEARLTQVMLEEMSWGDAGLSVSLGVAFTPLMMAKAFGNEFVTKKMLEGQTLGCWGLTEPDHGSDQLMQCDLLNKPNCVVTIKENELVVNGQKSAWVSNGPIATHACLFTACKDESGEMGMCVAVVPLDAPGVTRGKNLDKLGQRALPQGEIYFDNVTIEKEWLLAGPEHYDIAIATQLSIANTGMGMQFCGLARAAFEEALEYAHERKQGGKPIIEHQDVQRRLFDMMRKVEIARAMAQRSNEYQAASRPALLAAVCAKVTSTDMAMEVTSSALQMFGGNGLTREYVIEKMFRDARSAQIEDGCNHVLRIKAGSLLNKNNPKALL